MRPLLLALFVLLHTSVALAGTRLAVLDFAVASSDPAHAPLGVGMRSMLATDLSRAPDVTLVEREQLEAILAELDLQQSELVDPRSAVKLHRLLGATHLVDGSVTVSGELMRLDARLIDLQTGEVVSGESVEGERLAFFELEKDLVKRLIAGLAVQLAPKQRATVARVHTADWEAFVAFSQGVAAFDQDKYDEALAALDKALAVDGEFDLAELTQKEYAAIIERLRQRETALRTAAIESEKLERSEEAAASLDMIRRLEALAGADGESAFADRITALSLLHGLYREGGPAPLRSEIDAFQADRLADHYAQRYAAEVQDRWGRTRPSPIGKAYLRPDRFDRRFADEREAITYARYQGDAERLAKMVANHLDDCGSSSGWGRALHLDLGERVDRCAARMAVAASLEGSPVEPGHLAWKLSSWQIRAGRFDDAVRGLLLYAEGLDDARRVAGVRQRIEELRRLERATEGTASPDRVREVLLQKRQSTWRGQSMHEVAREHVGGRQPTPMGRYLLAQVRNVANQSDSFSREPYLLVGDHALWMRWGLRAWTTGPRPDPVRTESLTYFRPRDRGDQRQELDIQGPALALFGERMRSELGLELTVHHEPDEAWWPLTVRHRPGMKTHGVAPERARIELLIAARDLKVAPRRVPGEEPVLHRPFRAYVISFDDDEVVLERMHQVPPGWKKEVVREEIGRRARKGRGSASTRVRLHVSDRGEVRLELDGARYRFEIEPGVAGYPGFFMTTQGYARFEDIRLDQ